MKFDKGKARASLPFKDFPLALQELAKVSTMGANKYTAHSWKTVSNAEERYEDAFCRHFIQHWNEDVDTESGFSHLAHVAWNALALLQLELEKN